MTMSGTITSRALARTACIRLPATVDHAAGPRPIKFIVPSVRMNCVEGAQNRRHYETVGFKFRADSRAEVRSILIGKIRDTGGAQVEMNVRQTVHGHGI